MKVVFTGGGTGGHFYPIIAVAEALHALAREQKLLSVDMFYLAPDPYDMNALYENNITWKKVSAGKIRRHFSPLNIIDAFKTLFGSIGAIFTLYSIYPDVVFSKGGYVSFPVVFAARILNIPVIIHESDSVPGRVNKWAGKFAKKIAVSYAEAGSFFNKEKVAHTGNPVRKELAKVEREGALEFLKLESHVPVILVLGGSQGAKFINDTLVDALPNLVEKYQIIHQVGVKNFKFVKELASVVLEGSQYTSRYKPFNHLNILAMRMAAGAADLVVSRAGSTIFEIAGWNVPSIIIPLPTSAGDHQRENAYNYARSGATLVIEENNLTPHILESEINRIMGSEEEKKKMIEGARAFSTPKASTLIAEEILEIGLKHENK